ncbi:UNVERIFIED_CONTAM: hypothetical protein FKN15_023391, partial [Acipenser sinensis]
HRLWNLLSATLQTPIQENIELARQLAEEGKNVSKTQFQAGFDVIHTNARAVASEVAAQRCLQMKMSALTTDTSQDNGVTLPGALTLQNRTQGFTVPHEGGKTGYSVLFNRDKRHNIQKMLFQYTAIFQTSITAILFW